MASFSIDAFQFLFQTCVDRLVELDLVCSLYQFVWGDLNTEIIFGCEPKELHQDPLEQVVSV